jgi:hypothetical protein
MRWAKLLTLAFCDCDWASRASSISVSPPSAALLTNTVGSVICSPSNSFALASARSTAARAGSTGLTTAGACACTRPETPSVTAMRVANSNALIIVLELLGFACIEPRSSPRAQLASENNMKLTITVETDKYANVPWPDGVPLPAAGDEVTLSRAGEQISFVVDGCAFDLTEADRDGARVTIRAHHAPAGTI